jgi:nucleotide-binding universal stress UspA family protein
MSCPGCAAGPRRSSRPRARAPPPQAWRSTVLLECFARRTSDVVIEQATSWPADLIVLGTHGRRGIGRVMMGSDAEDIVRSAPVPVLLVRAVGTGAQASAGVEEPATSEPVAKAA